MVVVILFICLSYETFFYYNNSEAKNKKNISLALIQVNITNQEQENAQRHPELMKKLFEKYIRLSKEAVENEKPEIIILPEGAISRWVMRLTEYREEIYKFAIENNVYLLFGAPDLTEEGKEYNSAFLISPQGNLVGRYDKKILVPFKESFFASGTELGVMNINSIKVGVQICFEGIFENYTTLIKKGADIVFVLSSYGDFGYSSAHYLSSAITRIRAVENNVPIIQVTKSGISQIIDSNGKVLVKAKLGEDKIISYNIEVANNKKTFYSLYGKILYITLVLFALFLILYLHIKKFFKI